MLSRKNLSTKKITLQFPEKINTLNQKKILPLVDLVKKKQFNYLCFLLLSHQFYYEKILNYLTTQSLLKTNFLNYKKFNILCFDNILLSNKNEPFGLTAHIHQQKE